MHDFVVCSTQKGNVTTTAVRVVYNGSEELETNSKFGQGHYTYVGNIVKDGGLWSAIYGQSENNPEIRSYFCLVYPWSCQHYQHLLPESKFKSRTIIFESTT